MPWVADAVFGAGGVANLAGIGELRNPNFPTEVAVGEPWPPGTAIDAYNASTLPYTFRYKDSRFGDQVRESFPLQPGETKTLPIDGEGPANFWIFLERWVAEAPKLPWLLIGAVAASACVVGIVAVVAVKT